MFRKFFLLVLIFILIFLSIAVPVLAFDEIDTLSTTDTGISSDLTTKTFFYNSGMDASSQESSFTADYFTSQKARIVQEFKMYFVIQSISDLDSRNLLFDYLERDLEFLDFDGDVSSTVNVVHDTLFLNKMNKDGSYYSGVQFIGGSLEDCTLLECDVSLTYITYLGMLSYSETVGNVVLPLSRTSKQFYLQPIVPDWIWSNPFSFYFKPLSTSITPISPTPAPAGIWLSAWFSSSFHTAFYQYHIQNIGQISASCGANGLINNTAFNLYDNVSSFDLTVEKNFLFNVKSSQYTVSFTSLWFYPFIDNFYFQSVVRPGATEVVNDPRYWNDLPYSFNYIYSVRDPGIVTTTPNPGDSEFEIQNLYVTPEKWYDIPSYLNNFIIWFIFESPAISFVTKPIGQIVLVTKNVYSTYVLGLISALGIIGTFVLFKFFYKFIIKIFVR